jgi:DNA-directed RNA polymerase specialized sigma24 family protein
VSVRGSISDCLRLLKEGDRDAAQPLWEAYFARLVTLARARLRSTRSRAIADEDVAISAFDSFCRRAEAGAFPRLDDRHDLWQVLVLLTVRKARLVARRERRLKRGAGRVVAFADLDSRHLGAVLGSEPTPEEALELAEGCRRLLESLGDKTLEQVALWRLEGYSNREIAGRLGCIEKTVERKLKSIRQLWSNYAETSR